MFKLVPKSCNLVLRNTFYTTSFNLARKNSAIKNVEQEVDWEQDKPELDYQFDDHTTPAHHFLRQIRYVRSYLRKLKFEVPKLQVKVKPFEPKDSFAQFLKVDYLNEAHEANQKSTLIIDLEKFKNTGILNQKQLHKFHLLIKDKVANGKVRLTCTKFDQHNSNQAYLQATFIRLINEAKDTTDSFEDIKVQFKPTKLKLNKNDFPKEWIKN